MTDMIGGEDLMIDKITQKKENIFETFIIIGYGFCEVKVHNR